MHDTLTARPDPHEARKVTIPEGASGDWAVSHFTIERSTLHDLLRGRGIPPGRYTRLSNSREACFMSDTPAEYRDASYFIACATGHVLVSGLGLGMVIKALLLKSDVDSITVVELEADVIALVADHYADTRLRVVHGDAYRWKPDRRFDWAWHDIWADVSTDDLPDMARLCRHYAKAMTHPGRQMVWGRHLLRR